MFTTSWVYGSKADHRQVLGWTAASGEEAAIVTKNTELGFSAFPLFWDSLSGWSLKREGEWASQTMQGWARGSNWIGATCYVPQLLCAHPHGLYCHFLSSPHPTPCPPSYLLCLFSMLSKASKIIESSLEFLLSTLIPHCYPVLCCSAPSWSLWELSFIL